MIGEKGRGGFSWPSEATQFEQAQGGCAASLNELMQRHEKLVHFVVQRQWLFTLPYEEAVQAGRRGLWRAILGCDAGGERLFDLRLPGNYEVCLGGCKERTTAIAARSAAGQPGSVLLSQRGEPGKAERAGEIAECVLAMVKRLPRRLGFVIRAYYGLHGKEPQTLQAIGDQLGLTRERVRQLPRRSLGVAAPARTQPGAAPPAGAPQRAAV